MDHEMDGTEVHPAQNNNDFELQILGRTRSDGSTHQRGRFEDRFFGPYLNAMPVNPVNGLSSVRIMPSGISEPIFNGLAGWVYVTDTGKIFADLAGVDDRGIAFSEY